MRTNLFTHIVTDLFNDLKNGTLPAVSFVKPDGAMDGHPNSPPPVMG